MKSHAIETIEADRITCRGRRYTAPWIAGRHGLRVHIHSMPHHEREIVACDATAHAHLSQASASA
ncbi:Mu transposase C-terminal domain-containing protein [Nonomuraea sp. ATR24]|uniref:Mu transposase C-terminal domain-containing protein n=1 Tax=Nonomuraea sp. ATR24 TaxID=1676744 RepID=UPI0035C0E0FA